MKVLRRILLVIVILALLCAGAWLANKKCNERVVVTRYTYSDEKVPEAFDGYKLMVIADLHDTPFSDQILSHIEKEKPDMIVFVGDLMQLPDWSLYEASRIAEATPEIPKYAVSGNHDCEDYWAFLDTLWAEGIVPLDHDSVSIEKDGESFLLLGLRDTWTDTPTEEETEALREQIESCFPESECFSVLLFHRANLYPLVKDSGVDLILSGHLHGGLIRLPFIGGVIGRKEGEFFPDYDYGVFKEDDSATMIVSSGCDKNEKKMRVFNPPEVLMVTLESE